MKQLLTWRDDLNNRVRLAELAGQKPTNQFLDWLDRVNSINVKTGKRLADIAALQEASNYDVVAASRPPSGLQEEPSVGAVAMATQQSMGFYLSQLRAYLQDDGTRIIGIWGMGGVGKTTLLHSLNSELHEGLQGLLQFEQVIWVVASKDYKVGNLQHDIAGRLGLLQHEDRHRQAREIFDFLRNKSFLLLLDDLWQHVDFTEVGIPHPHRPGANGGIGAKQKVVFTTRLEGVCGKMEARRKVKLECLKEEEAWRLFQEKVGDETMSSHVRIPQLARRVAKECDGLPLALVVIGTAMSTKKTPKEWQNAITLLQKSRLYEIHGMDDNILPKLKFSYDNLPDEIFRKCFLLCSLWPEDYSISKADLIECWMGHELIDETKFDNINEVYDRGHSLIGCLLATCLLEPGNDKDTEVKMHDIVRDLALWIASACGDIPNRFIVRSGRSEDSQREVEKISLVHSELIDTSGLSANCAKLETLILQKNISFKSIVAGFFEGTPVLTYLDLSYTAINDLPEEIGRLGKLRYLNLSKTNIKGLPGHLGCLHELRFLMLRELDCIIIPKGLLQKLVMLSLIDMTGTWCDKWWELEKLPGCLKGVGIVLETIEALQQLANVPIWWLELRELIGFQHPLQLLSPLQLGSHNIRSSIQMLAVKRCHSLDLMSVDTDGGKGLGPNWCLPRLEEVKLVELSELKEIVWRGVVPSIVMPSLTVRKIIGCEKLSNISWVAWLPSLEELMVYFCDEMEQVVVDESREEGGRGDHGEGCEAFPSLRCLYLYYLPNLRMLGGRLFGFPSLEVVHVIRCPNMKRLSFGAEVAGNKLREIRGHRNWWDRLEMDCDMRAALLSRFKEANIPRIWEL